MNPQQSQNGGGNPSGNQQGMNPSSGHGSLGQQNQFPVSPFFHLQPPRVENMTVNFYQPGNYSVLMDMNPCPDQVAEAQEESRFAAIEASRQRFQFLNQGPSGAAGGQQTGQIPGRRSITETQSIQTVRNEPAGNGIILLIPIAPPAYSSARTQSSSGGSMNNVNTPRPPTSSDSEASGKVNSDSGYISK